jgi:hypothetical protein
MTNSNFKTDIIITLKNNISATYHQYNIDNKNLYALAELAYESYCINKRKLSIDDFSNDLMNSLNKNDNTLISKFIDLFYEKIYHKVSYYVHAKTNGMPLNNINYSMTCDNVVRPIGCNSATFENNPTLDTEVNDGLLKALSI